jgi:hypothetical protein
MLKRINSMLLLMTILTITACSKEFLDTKPTDSISAGDALASASNLNLVLNGLHRQMYAQSPLAGGSSSRAGEHYWIPLDDVITGSLIHSARANGWMRSDLQWLSHTDENSLTVDQLWYQRYHYIASANAIINQVEELGLAVGPDISNVLGQAHAYRAWAYLKLVTHYAKGYIIGNPATDPGVPLLTSTESPYESAPRSTVAEIYNQIETDINQSITYFQDASAPENKSHLSINAAYGIKSRVALSKGDWQTAAEAAVLARDGFPLLNESDWLSGFYTTNLSEVIWGGTLIDTETTYYRSYFYLICPTFNGSQNRGNPKLINKLMYDQIPATDFRRKMALPDAPNSNSSASNDLGGSAASDPNYTSQADFTAAKAAIIAKYGMTSRHNTHPYMHVKFLQENPGTIDPDDVIYMRSAEMYLNEIEAKIMLNDLAGARTALQTFGESRDTAYDATVFTTKDQLLTQLKFQRYVELYGEGFSYTDHIRWDQAIDLTGSGASLVLYQDGYTQAKPSVNEDWIWKIPQDEIDANPYISESDQN